MISIELMADSLDVLDSRRRGPFRQDQSSKEPKSSWSPFIDTFSYALFRICLLLQLKRLVCFRKWISRESKNSSNIRPQCIKRGSPFSSTSHSFAGGEGGLLGVSRGGYIRRIPLHTPHGFSILNKERVSLLGALGVLEDDTIIPLCGSWQQQNITLIFQSLVKTYSNKGKRTITYTDSAAFYSFLE